MFWTSIIIHKELVQSIYVPLAEEMFANPGPADPWPRLHHIQATSHPREENWLWAQAYMSSASALASPGYQKAQFSLKS